MDFQNFAVQMILHEMVFISELHSKKRKRQKKWWNFGAWKMYKCRSLCSSTGVSTGSTGSTDCFGRVLDAPDLGERKVLV